MFIALTTQAGASGFALPTKADGTLNYDMAIPMMLGHYFPPGLLGLGLTALMASFTIYLASDPLGDGSDLLGGADGSIDYSVLSATAGCTRIAARVGSQHAMSATASSAAMTTAKLTGSVGSTP